MSWEDAQVEEKIFWELQNYDMEKCYSIKYAFFDEFIKDKDIKAIDIGCGAISYALQLGLTDLTLCDSQLYEYICLPDNKCNFKNYSTLVQANVEKLPFEDDSFELVLLLNVLDHVNNPEKAMKEVARVARNNILFFCDLRTKPDACHPTKISQDDLRKWFVDNDLRIDKEIVRDSFNGMQALLAVLTKSHK